MSVNLSSRLLNKKVDVNKSTQVKKPASEDGSDWFQKGVSLKALREQLSNIGKYKEHDNCVVLGHDGNSKEASIFNLSGMNEGGVVIGMRKEIVMAADMNGDGKFDFDQDIVPLDKNDDGFLSPEEMLNGGLVAKIEQGKKEMAAHKAAERAKKAQTVAFG